MVKLEKVMLSFNLTLKLDFGLIPENLLCYSGLIFKIDAKPEYLGK